MGIVIHYKSVFKNLDLKGDHSFYAGDGAPGIGGFYPVRGGGRGPLQIIMTGCASRILKRYPKNINIHTLKNIPKQYSKCQKVYPKILFHHVVTLYSLETKHYLLHYRLA